MFEIHIESEKPVEVRWFKDNLPLNSPDYETRHEGNIASLTIEETFSEDTARYTIKVSNMYGEVESSAYLHVKGTLSFPIPVSIVSLCKETLKKNNDTYTLFIPVSFKTDKNQYKKNSAQRRWGFDDNAKMIFNFFCA